MRTMHRIVLVMGLLALVACSGEEPPAGKSAPPPASAPATPPRVAEETPAGEPGEGEESRTGRTEAADMALLISPTEVYGNTTLELDPTGFDLMDAQIVWMVNGQPVSVFDPYTFDIGRQEVAKGSDVRARAQVGEQNVLSNIVKVRNSPPRLSLVKIIPDVLAPGETVGVQVETEDVDGDPVTVEYQWTRNGEPAGRGPRIEAPLGRGDTFAVRVVPYDGFEYGRFARLERTMENLPPEFEQVYDYDFDGTTYTYQVRATDPDGDRVTYSLVSGPEGMLLEPASGIISWRVPPDLIGKTSFIVAAEDGRGGRREMALSFTLSQEEVDVVSEEK
jgi:hypothetical protein